MKLVLSQRAGAVVASAALALSVALSAHSVAMARQGPPATTGNAPAAAPQEPAGGQRGAAAGRGGGRGAAANVLGDGPWEFTAGGQRIKISVVTKGLDHPWGLAFLPDGDMLVTERPGRLRVIRKGVLDPTPIAGLPPIRTATLGGLMDIALHPGFAANRLIYLSYSKPGVEDPARATTAVLRARWDGGATLSEVTDVLVADGYHGGRGAPRGCCGQGPSDGSYGSRLAFDRAGLLYITVGDRNYGEKSQDPSSHIGKILRVRDDGSLPSDNPFAGREGYKPEIYSLGHRNPLGLTFHPVTNELWSTEFGPRGGDELNRIRAGGNYGWILVSEGAHYDGTPHEKGKNSVPGMEDPVLFWVPSINPGNLLFYNGERFPSWKGNMLMAAMSRSILRVTFDAAGKPLEQERMFSDLAQRFRDVRTGPDGLIYALTDETAGAVLKIEPAQ